MAFPETPNKGTATCSVTTVDERYVRVEMELNGEEVRIDMPPHVAIPLAQRILVQALSLKPKQESLN